MIFTTLLLIISILAIIILSSYYKFSTFFVLIFVAICVGLFAGISGEQVIKALKAGFGATMEKVGLLIILGVVLGILLEKSKATLSLAHFILLKTGEKYAPLAITLIGFLIGLPIFCDSGFIVLIGLTLSLGHKIPKSQFTLVCALATSLYGVHCLVPPHPGITSAAAILNVDIGKAMLIGAFVSIPSTIAAYFWNKYVGAEYQENYEKLITSQPAEISTDDLPNPYLSFLPIIVPIILIALKSILGVYPAFLPEQIIKIAKFLGEPVVALMVGILLSLFLFQKVEKKVINQLLEESIEKAGPILAVIAAGGAFGEIIKTLDIGRVYADVLKTDNLGLLIPFGLALIFKTAQGSSTVAVISAASICLPLLPSLGLESEWGRLLALSAMGAGSMVVSHANDAYFWVITKFGNSNVNLTLRSFTPASALMGFVALATIYSLKWYLGV